MSNKLKNKLRFWIYLILIIALYGGFMAYFCMAKPCEPNNVVIEQEKTVEKNTSTTKIISPEFYLCKITEFYQQVITLLFGVIGILLVVSFLYLHITSKGQAEEMAIGALKEESFGIKLDKMVEDRFIKSKNEGDIADICQGLEDINERLSFLENVITEKSYKLEIKDSAKEKPNGNN